MTSWPRWFPRCKHASAIDGAPFTVGCRFEIRFDFPIPVSVKCVVDEIDLGKRARWIGSGFGIRGDHSYTLEAVGGGLTRVTSREAFSGPGALLITRAIRERLDGEVARSLDRFKALVEAA